jgi:hypothetical protein
MKISLKSFIAGVLIGSCFSFFIPAIAATMKQKVTIEKTISNFVHSLRCHTVDVRDIDLWEGKVLVKARKMNISFVMTALDSAAYEICPVGLNVHSLKVIPAKPE